MDKAGMSIGGLAAAVGVSYEHARKLAKGLTPPSQDLCERVARVLHIDAAEAWTLVQEDKLEQKFGTALRRKGKAPVSLSGKECSRSLLTQSSRLFLL